MNEITKNQKVIILRDGTEIWIEKDRAENFGDQLMKITESKFVKIDDQIINTADITGIFSPETLEEKVRRKRGQWYCTSCKKWHDRGERCEEVRIPSHIAKFLE